MNWRRSWRWRVANGERVSDEYKLEWTRFKETYVALARRYPIGFARVDET